MKKIKLSALILAAAAFIAACNNAGQNRDRDRDTTDINSPMDPAPPVDTTMNDTMFRDTL